MRAAIVWVIIKFALRIPMAMRSLTSGNALAAITIKAYRAALAEVPCFICMAGLISGTSSPMF